jgi:multiple sugar transport system substrate-binding protein
MTRRALLKAGALTGGALALPAAFGGGWDVVPTAADQGVQLTWMLSGGVQVLQMMKQMVSSFNKSYPTIHVTPSVVPVGGYDERTDLLLAANTPPAVWFPWENRGYRYYASRGWFPSIDDLIANDHFDLTDFYKPQIDFCIWNGHHVGLPTAFNSSILIYNKTLFDKARVPYPPTDWNDRSWDYDKFLEYAKELTRFQGGKAVQWGTDSPSTDPSFEPFWLFGGEIFDEQSYVTGFPTKTIMNTPEVADAFQFISDLIHKYKVQPTPAQAQATQAGAPSLFQTGKIAMEATANWAFEGYAAIKHFEWGIAAQPWPPRRYGLPRRIQLYPNQWMIFKNQAHRKEAWALEKWLCSPEGLTLWVQAGQGISPRKSQAAAYKPLLKSWNPRLTDAELQCAVVAVNYGKITPSHAIVNYAPIWQQAINPIYQKLQLGDLTGKQAQAQMIAAVQRALQQYPAPH